jgi:hypothetical protein
MEAIAAAGPIMQVAGTGLNTYSNVMASDVNAKSLQAQARSVEENTKFEVQQQQREAKIQAGTNNATMAATGLDITRGSPLFQQLDFAKQAEIEKQSIQRSGNIEAANKRFDARMTRRQIPFQIARGAMQSASILTKIAGGLSEKGGQ